MKLLEFPHSHYCEKARWALDYKGCVFQQVPILPGFHLWTVRRYAPRTSVPVLLLGDRAVQGSTEIIDFLEATVPTRPLSPSVEKERARCLSLENEMDLALGVPIRQILYHRLLAYPSYIRHCFAHSLPLFKQMLFSLSYPLLQKKIYQVYVKSDEEAMQARRIFDETLDKLGNHLAGKQYLVGDQFSRADLTVAAMLSLLVI